MVVAAIDDLKAAFCDSLGIDETVDFSNLAYGEIEEWDSVAHLQLVAAIEDTFDIMIDTDDVIAMSSFGVVKDILAKNYEIRFDA